MHTHGRHCLLSASMHESTEENQPFAMIEPEPLGEAELAAARGEYRMLKWLLVVALWVSCALALSLSLADPDLWGHVRYGQDVIRDGHLHRTATHTYTAVGYPWVNHENIAELTYATVYAWFDDEGLQVFKTLVGLGILALMAWVGHRNGVKIVAISAFLLLVANNLTAFFPVRPQVLSFAWCALMLVVFERAFTGWSLWLRDKEGAANSAPADAYSWSPRQLAWLLLVPPIMVLWTNSHGAFVAGVCIACAYLGGRAIEAVYYRRRAATGVATALVGTATLVVVATLINPYGTGLHQWLLASLGSPRPEITEWAAPKQSDPVFWPFVVLVGVTVASWTFTRRRRDWVQIVILALVCWQACSHVRHIAFFTLLCGFWLAPHLQSAMRRLKSDTSRMPVQRLGPWWRWGFAGALSLAILLQAHAVHRRLSMLPVHRANYPVDAFQWMTFKGVHGKLVVSFNWAQYAIAALSPDTTVAFDGRFRTCYPQSVVDQSFDFLLGENKGRRFRRTDAGPIDPTAILELDDPDLVLVDRKYKHSVEVMEDEAAKADPQWSLLYQDGIAQLWGRKSVYDDSNSTKYLPPKERLITDRIHKTAFPWPALPFQSVVRPVAEHHDANRPHSDSL